MNPPPPCMVWLPADHRLLGDHGHQMPFLLLGDKYARAVKVGAQAQPVMFPLADAGQIGELLPLVDGVMLTGSPSNVHPSHFDEAVADPSLPLDPVRDTLTLALVKACVHEGIPLLGICRGFQEINVALGGTLLATLLGLVLALLAQAGGLQGLLALELALLADSSSLLLFFALLGLGSGSGSLLLCADTLLLGETFFFTSFVLCTFGE